jgi:hypothetical protein
MDVCCYNSRCSTLMLFNNEDANGIMIDVMWGIILCYSTKKIMNSEFLLEILEITSNIDD